MSKTYFLIEVTDKVPSVKAEYTDWKLAVNAQEVLTDLIRKEGVPVFRQWFAVREEGDELLEMARTPITPDPAPEAPESPPKPKRVQTRTVEGIKMICKEPGFWESEDGHYWITWDDDFTTECEGPHPAKIGKETRAWWKSLTDWERTYKPRCSELRWALLNEKKGYMCPGGEEHTYGLWVVSRDDASDVISRDDTFKDALGMLAEHIRTGKTWG